ncbi:DUF4917 family protein [Bdellovibrio sp. BCCA]|uniref:DUF4917 family protein n=1 Tax=Bdellovibrio sp. BCCA TaxID=3136281 RepID=UPI0030F0A433
MKKIELKRFDDCIKSAVSKKKHVLLGNGFSRACRNEVFSYDSLFKSADFSRLSVEAKQIFQLLDTTDFEIVMKSLNVSATIMPIYGCAADISNRAQSDSGFLRSILVNTIAKHHPPLPSSISEEEYANCIKFLSNFDKIYSLNYDLLLYWTLMKQRELGGSEKDDGFRDPSEIENEISTEDGYVAWANDTHGQNIHYIHGALHIFYQKALLQKFCWSRTGTRLLEQIDTALKSGKFPLIVAEGTANQKLERIQKSNYLGFNFRSLRNCTGTLFTFGVSFGDADKHIMTQIQKNTRLEKICVSVFGDIDSENNLQMIQSLETITNDRPASKPLTLEFYEANSARVWK